MASICFVLFFFFDNRDWRILHSLLELTWLKRVRDLIQSIIQDYNNDEQEKYINLYKLINFYYGRHHYLSRNNNQTWWPIRLHEIDLNIKLHKRIRMPNYPRVGGSLNIKQALYDPSEANTAFFILPIYRLRWGRGLVNKLID